MITRRNFGLALAAAPLASAAEDFSGDLDRYLTSLAKEQWTARKAKVAALRTPADVRARQEFIRKWVIEANGGIPSEKTPLNARVTGTLERDGYTVEKLVYESLPKFYVTANVYVPASGSGPFPAVLGVAGHSATGKSIETYQHVWISLAKRGFVVLAFDPPGQGERLQYLDPATGKSTVGVGTREHTMAGLQCLLTGTTYARYEMIDGIRGLDYLLTRKDVDPKRIAVAGNSGGGTQAAYLAVAEPRLASAVASCYITSWETLWDTPGPQDAEQVFPGFLEAGLDFGDFLIAFAPKPVMMTTAIRDFFPIAGARDTFAEVDKVFTTADAPGRAGYFEYDDTHGWSQPRREACYRWLSKWLQSREDNGAEPPHKAEPEENLNVTSTGQVASSLGGETVWSVNLQLAEQQHARRTALKAKPGDLRQIIRSRLKMPAVKGTVQVAEEDSELRITTEPGIQIPAVLKGAAAGQRRPAVIWIDEAGRSAAPPAADGEVVLAIDARGFGASAVPSGGKGYAPDYQRAMRALLVGRTMLGMQVTDALRCFDYLRSRKDVDPKRIRIAGRGHGGIVAQLAGALEPGFAGVSSEKALVSWMEMARSRTHSGLINAVVPGVLQDFDLPDLARLIAPRPFQLS